MKVMALWMNENIISGSSNVGLKTEKNSELLAYATVYNSSTHVEDEVENDTKGLPTSKKTGKKIAVGNVTEIGMFNYLMESKIDVESLVKQRSA